MYGIILQGCMHFHHQGKISGKNLVIHWLPTLKKQLTFWDAISGSILMTWWLLRSHLLVLLIGWSKFSTNLRHHPDLGSGTSSLWHFCACSSDIILQGNRLGWGRRRGWGGGVCCWTNFCWVCAAGLSEPLAHCSLFCGQYYRPHLSHFWANR